MCQCVLPYNQYHTLPQYDENKNETQYWKRHSFDLRVYYDLSFVQIQIHNALYDFLSNFISKTRTEKQRICLEQW